MKQDFKSGQSIAFIGDGHAGDGGAWVLVVSPIVMEHVRMDVAEVVFRWTLEVEGRVCQAGLMDLKD